MTNSTKKWILMAMFMALQITIGLFRIPVGENLSIYLTFLVTMLVAIIFPYKEVLIYAIVEDNISFILFPQGSYFAGYTLTAVVGLSLYYFFLHGKTINFKNVLLAKLSVNLLANVCLNSLWSYILYSKGFLYYAGKSLIKNLLLCPIEVMLFMAFFTLISPLLKKYGLVKE